VSTRWEEQFLKGMDKMSSLTVLWLLAIGIIIALFSIKKCRENVILRNIAKILTFVLVASLIFGYGIGFLLNGFWDENINIYTIPFIMQFIPLFGAIGCACAFLAIIVSAGVLIWIKRIWGVILASFVFFAFSVVMFFTNPAIMLGIIIPFGFPVVSIWARDACPGCQTSLEWWRHFAELERGVSEADVFTKLGPPTKQWKMADFRVRAYYGTGCTVGGFCPWILFSSGGLLEDRGVYYYYD